MSECRFFIPSEVLFPLLADKAEQRGLTMVFRRYTPSGYDAAVHTVALDDDLAGRYHEGGYSQLTLSRDTLPRDERDLSFTNDSFRDVLELNGARQRGSLLEQGVLRTVAKKSTVTLEFRAIKRAIAKVCNRGVTVRGTSYPNVYWHRSLATADYELRATIDDDSFVYRIDG